jgi:hypothetical protein
VPLAVNRVGFRNLLMRGFLAGTAGIGSVIMQCAFVGGIGFRFGAIIGAILLDLFCFFFCQLGNRFDFFMLDFVLLIRRFVRLFFIVFFVTGMLFLGVEVGIRW